MQTALERCWGTGMALQPSEETDHCYLQIRVPLHSQLYPAVTHKKDLGETVTQETALLQGWASITCTDYTLTGCRALNCTAPHCTVLHCTALQCTLLYRTSLYCIVL